MWICLNDAFVSAVEHNDNPDLVVVRARNENHLKTLFPGEEIIVIDGSDYDSRVIITKEKLAEVISNRIHNIDYGNFKNSVFEDTLHSFYESVWYAGLKILGGRSCYRR